MVRVLRKFRILTLEVALPKGTPVRPRRREPRLHPPVILPAAVACVPAGSSGWIVVGVPVWRGQELLGGALDDPLDIRIVEELDEPPREERVPKLFRGTRSMFRKFRREVGPEEGGGAEQVGRETTALLRMGGWMGGYINRVEQKNGQTAD